MVYYDSCMRFAYLLLAAVSVLTAEDGVLVRVQAHAGRFGTVSRQIWELAETGYREQKSSALLKDELRRSGFSIDDGVGGMPTAFTASWGAGKPVIAIL